MLVDTHCHLDAREFDPDRSAIAQAALENDVGIIVIPAVHRDNFSKVEALAKDHRHCVHALGIHPLAVPDSRPEDLAELDSVLQSSDPVAIGEIGLDFYIEDYDREAQEFYFVEQLKLAKKFDLPVILHVRRSSDIILKHLRKFDLRGIAHAFNGSEQQAHEFIKLGFKLGYGGAMTYPRALRIRNLAQNLPLESIVLETDSPDIPPEWIGTKSRNTPVQLPKIAQVLADLRGVDIAEIAEITSANALQALPKLAYLYTSPHV